MTLHGAPAPALLDKIKAKRAAGVKTPPPPKPPAKAKGKTKGTPPPSSPTLKGAPKPPPRPPARKGGTPVPKPGGTTKTPAAQGARERAADTVHGFPARKIKGLPPRRPKKPTPAKTDDRPRPASGEMIVQQPQKSSEGGETISVKGFKLPTAVLDAYADDALRAITEYEAQLGGEADADRVGRLHYEIGRLYETVLGNFERAAHHFDRALVSTPQHLPTIVAARRVRQSMANPSGALELYDREIELSTDRVRKAALWFSKGRMLEDALGRHDDAHAAYRAATSLIEADPALIKALEQSDRRRKDWSALSRDLEALANALDEAPPLRAAVVVQRARLHEVHLEEPGVAAELYESALAIEDAVAPDVLPVLQRLYEQRERWGDLVRVLRGQADRSDDPELRATAYYRIGQVQAEQLGNLTEAIAAMKTAAESVPRAKTLEALARLHARGGDHHAHAATLTDLVDLVPDERERLGILLRLARLCHEQIQDEEMAITALEAARGIDPAYPPVLHLLAPLYTKLERWDALVEVYRGEAEASIDTPARAVAHAHAAEVLERMGDEAAAMANHERAIDFDPDQQGSMRALVRLYTKASAFRKLVDLYERFIDRLDSTRRIHTLMQMGALLEGPLADPAQAIVVFRRVLSIESRHLGAVQAIGRVAEASGQWSTLVEVIEQEIEIGTDPRQRVMLWHRAGEVLDSRLGKRSEAVVRYRRALAIDEGHRPSLAKLAQLYTVDKRWSELTEIYGKQLELEPKGKAAVALWQRLGEVHERERAEPDEAAKCYRQALQLDPRAPMAARGLARILDEQHKWAELATLRDSQRKNAGHPDDELRLTLATAELYEHELSDLESAATHYSSAHELRPDDRPATAALRRVRALQKDWATLADELEHEAAQHSDPRRSIEDLSYAGEIRAERLGDVDGAIACFRGVLDLQRDNLPALVALEPLLRAKGDTDGLVDLYDRQVAIFRHPGARVAALHEQARLVERHRPDDADELIELYSTILASRTEDHRALHSLERLALRSGKPEALAGIDARLARLSQHADLRAAYMTRRAEAMELSGNPEAIKVYREVLRLDPRNRGALRGLTRMAELLRDDEALAEAAERGAENITEPEPAADAWVRAGSIKTERLADHDGAIADFERALTKWPDHREGATRLSKVMRELGRHRSLVERLVKTAEAATEPGRIASLWMQIATLQSTELDNPGAAQSSLQRLLREQPDCAEAMLALGRLYLADRRADEATELFERCVAAKPSDEIVHAAHALLAQAHQTAGRVSEAFTHYGAALEADPNDVDLLRRVARLQLDEGHHAAAADAAKRLLELSKDEASRVEALGWVAEALVGRGELDEAMGTWASLVGLQGPRSSAATEMMERATGPEHWQRYVDALGTYLDERAALGPARVTLFGEIAQLQHERLGNPSAAMSTLIRGLRESDGDTGLRLLLAQRLAEARRAAEAIGQLQVLVSDDASRTEGWRLMARCFGEIGRTREQQLAQAALVATGDGRADEIESVANWRPHTRAIRPGVLVPAAWAELQLGGDHQTAIGNLLAAICDGLGKLRPADLSNWGVASRDRIAARSDHPMRVIVDRLASFFALDELDVYVHRHQGRGVGVENTSRPSLLLPIWLGDLPQSQQIFLITQALAHIARGTYPVHLMAPRDLALTIAAAIRTVAPGYGNGLAPAELLDDRARLLTRGVPRRKRKMLEGTAQVCAAMQPLEPNVLVHWLHQTTGRLAAIVSDDIVNTVSVIRRTDDIGEERGADLLARSPVIDDLLRTWMTEPAMVVRRRIGLVPAAAAG